MEGDENVKVVSEMFAEILGLLSPVRLHSISSTFFAEIVKKENDPLSLINGIRHLKLIVKILLHCN